MNGDYAGSNQVFAAAQSRIQGLSGASDRVQTPPLANTDGAQSYATEDFEKVLLQLYRALNDLQLDDLPLARAEALQVEAMQREIDDKNQDGALAAVALWHYLSGMIAEELKQYSDAMNSYRKAYEAYGVYRRCAAMDIPDFIKRDLLRLAQQQGLDEEVARYKKEFQIGHWLGVDDLASMGELVFIFSDGLAPFKREQSKAVIDPTGENIERISLPSYEPRPATVTAARVTVGAAIATTETAEDINAIAIKGLEAKIPRLTHRAMARAVVKARLEKMAKANPPPQNQNAAPAGEDDSPTIARADTRSWLTLPATIQLARLPLPPGNYSVRVDYLGEYQAIVETMEYANVTIRQGVNTYLAAHWTAQ